MGDLLEYPDLVQEVRGAFNPGRLKLQSNGVSFKNIKTGIVDQYPSSDIEKVSWLKRARGNCIKISLSNGTIHRYDGFKETEFERLSDFMSKNYSQELKKVDLSVKGWNWGHVNFEGGAMEFSVGPKMAFEIPLVNVSHATTAKNEVTLEFHLNDDAAVSLVELRFHIPTDPNAETDTVEEFYNNVLEKADVIQATGDALTSLTEIQCLTPRGRYDIKLYPTFLQLHGKTFDYKVPYTTILRLFLLPHKEQMFFVMSLDPPIKQGQTRYHFLILLFAKDDEMTVELALSQEELNEKYDGKLSPEMSGPEYEIVSRIFKSVTKRKITVPGQFMSNQKHHCLSCSYRAATGLLYPLERGFIFVHKPPLHIRFDEIACVNFARSAGSTRSFDFDIETTQSNVYTFNGIEKDEYGRLFDFVTSKKLRLKNVGGKLGSKSARDYMDGSDSDGAQDGYLERMKTEGRQRNEENNANDDDSDDSSDESFNPGDSGSEVAEEYDSNPPTTSSSDESDGTEGNEEEKKKKKEQKEKDREQEMERKKRPKSAKTVSEGKTRKRKKDDKDPNKPKRAQSSYMLWLADTRETIKEENPGISATDILKRAGEMWKEVTDKSKWEQLAEKAKEEYADAMKEYNSKQKEQGAIGASSEKSPKRSPKKVSSNLAGAGKDFKSKEFISSSDESGNNESDKKPLKKKLKIKKEKKEKQEQEEEDDEEETDDRKGTRKSKRMNKGGSESESSVGELPEEEETLKTPTASEQSASESN